jgi:LDH2 family malate/lactate/ureidoglycolate dehydrogenase
MNVSVDRVREQVVAVLAAWGMDEAIIRVTADVMVDTDLSGIDSHGISMLMDYDQSRLKGKLNLAAKPKVVRQNAVTALIDADAGLGHYPSVQAMTLAIDKALAAGVAVVSVVNSHHFGAAGYYSAMAPRRGLIGLVASSSRTISVVPTRGKIPVLGTNPLSFAAPARRNRPFHLDMATATVAANKVRVHDLNGRPLPPGWVIDENGEPVRDAALAVDYIFRRDVGGLTPVGGTPEMASYKGYGLAVMAQILGGALSGASFSPIRVRTQRPQDPDNIGHFFLALDPRMFRPDGAFEDDVDTIVDVLHETAPVDPAAPVLVAGDPEAAARERRRRDGIPIPPALATKIRAVCERCGARFVLE